MEQQRLASFESFLDGTPTLSELTRRIQIDNKWYILGTLLEIESRKLNSIEKQPGCDDVHKTLKMFELWLATTPTASRKHLLEMLRERVIGENTVAEEYEKYLKEQHNTNCKISVLLYFVFDVSIISVRYTTIC